MNPSPEPEPEDEEIAPFARPIASPPPEPSRSSPPSGAEFYGVNLDDKELPADDAALQGSPPRSSPSLRGRQDLIEPIYDAEPPLDLAAPSSPAVRSPKSPPVQQAVVSSSPAARQSSLYGSPPPYSGPRNHRPSNSSNSQARPRTDVVQTRASPQSKFVEPSAAPHKPQPHFYNLPDLDLNLGFKKEQQTGQIAGSEKYCCCFDSFADSGDEASATRAKDALLVGSEGSLEVFRILPNKLEVVGRLEGLRGGVTGAKILPHTLLENPLKQIRPLVAVIIHGLMDDPPVKRDSKKRGVPDEPAGYYQITVEVYSLQTQQHLATLYRSTPAVIEQPTIGHLSTLPEPIGDLRITAQGRWIVVASGKSGEVFVFTGAATQMYEEGHFRCVGKFWTSLQSPLNKPSSRPTSSSETGQSADELKEKTRAPLLSLSQRWLALVPPSTSSRVSIQGSSELSESYNPNPPGLASAVAPPQPSPTCDVLGLEQEDTWSRLTRSAAKGLVKYSHKGIDLGWQGWKELTNPTSQSAHPGHTPSKERDELFPPTNAPPDDLTRTHREPDVVSVVDLTALLAAEETKPKYTPPPLAAFALEEGCNFVSLSNTGLRILTASRKGDVSTIWDLEQACHGVARLRESSKDPHSVHAPCVKLVHHISRNSPSLVVDCAWARDDDNLALLTAHGTVHLHEVPARSPSRKRKRAQPIAAPAAEKAEAVVSVSSGSSPPSSNGGLLSNIWSGWQSMSSGVNSIRSQNPFSMPTTFAGVKETTARAGQAGGRVIAKSLSQGYSAAKGGASDYWHADDNKIRHTALQQKDRPGSLKWIKRQSDVFLAIVCGGNVHLHPVQRLERRKGDEMVSGLKADKYGKKQFALPSIRTRTTSDATNGVPQSRKAKDRNSCNMQGPHGFWSLRSLPSANELRRPTSRSMVSPANEVETNPPYCPFHIDSRVSIYAFDDPITTSTDSRLDAAIAFHIDGHDHAKARPWTFGEPLPTSTKMNIHETAIDIHRQRDYDSDDVGVDSLAEQMESTLTVHRASTGDGRDEIRINTRPSQVRSEHDDEGFDDAWEDEDDA